MCTLTWSRASDGYELFMNRDERHSRGLALPPAVHDASGVRYVAPIDSDAGGSWIATNEYGLTLALLNHYPTNPPPGAIADAPRSRGTIVTSLASHPSINRVTGELLALPLREFRPFTLFLIDSDGRTRLHQWDGAGETRVDEPDVPISSSGFNGAQVVAERVRTYRRLVDSNPTPARLAEFHRSHYPERGAYSVCAHRDDAGTKSLTRVRVGSSAIAMRYHAGPPCEAADEHERSLARRAPPR